MISLNGQLESASISVAKKADLKAKLFILQRKLPLLRGRPSALCLCCPVHEVRREGARRVISGNPESSDTSTPNLTINSNYCLRNLPYKFKWTEKTVPVAEGSSKTTAEGYMENYKNVSQDIRDQLNAKAEVDLETNLYWDFGKFTSRLESYYSRFYKMMNELVRNQCDVTNHQVNVQFLLQLQPEWKRFVTLVKQSQELKTVSCHKLYDILKQHQNEVNEIRAERLARTANPRALVAQQQLVYHPQHNPNRYTYNSSTRSQQTTRNRGKEIVNYFASIYDQEPATVTEDDEMSKEKEIDKLMALISLSFKKIYKPTNNNLLTSSNTSRANQDNSPRINRGTGYENHRVINVVGSRENVAYHKEKMLLCKQEEARVQLNAEQADWKDDIDDESDNQELEAHYMYMAQIQEVTLDIADNSGPIFDAEPLQKDDTDKLSQECDLLASLIEKLKCEIDDNKNRNKFLETSNKDLVDKLKGEIEDFKTKNKSLKSSNNHFKEANNELFKTNQLMFKDLKKFQAELIGVTPTTSVSSPQLKSNQLEDRVMHNNSQGKMQQVKDHRSGGGCCGVRWWGRWWQQWCGRGGSGGGMMGQRVGASDIVDRVDREVRKLYGFARKSPPEKFSGGGSVVAVVAGGQRPAVGRE
nr:hypothetical protein [Tanacetum cinerariifolium]